MIYAFHKKSESGSPHQLCHLDYISQFSTNIEYVAGTDNVVADFLSPINVLQTSPIDFQMLTQAQIEDDELKTLLTNSSKSSLVLQKMQMTDCLSIFCDVSHKAVRLYVLLCCRRIIFSVLQDSAHPGICPTKKVKCFTIHVVLLVHFLCHLNILNTFILI